MAALAADRNLLFGLLALQNGLINQGQLVAAFQAWTLDKARALADHLVGRGDLDADDRSAVEALVAHHLKKHGGDVERSLAAIPAGRSTRASLARIDDPDVSGTLAHLGSASTQQEEDADRTAPYSVGEATSDGQRFRVLRPHARGGLGAVFVALDEELHREVALKQILEKHADDPTSRARFLLEAEITGGLEHPGIVPVYGLGTYGDGRPYYAMRFIRGDSLKEAIARFHAAEAPGPDPGRRSLELRKLLRRFIDVCNAIDYAHIRGVLHRDIKPGNIIVGKHGETLVVDWGLAKPLGRSDPASGERTLVPSSASGSAETLPGSALGTPAYMSPEQARGELEHLGPYSDVYSLGATLYCLLTAKPPQEGDDVGAILGKVQRGEFTPPRQLDPSIERALEAICMKAMALKPENRYASCRMLAEDIERWMADEPVSAMPEDWPRRLARWSRRHRSATRAAVVSLAAITAAATLAALAVSREEAQTRRALSAETKARLSEGQARKLAQEQSALAMDAIREYTSGVTRDFLLQQPEMEGLRKALLQAPLRFYRRLAQNLEENGLIDADSHGQLGRAQLDLSGIMAKVSTLEDSIATLEQAQANLLPAVRNVSAARSRSASFEDQLAPARTRAYLGNRYDKASRQADARKLFDLALDDCQRLASEHPEDFRALALQAETLQFRADFLWDHGDLDGSRRDYIASIAISSRLVADHPQDMELIDKHGSSLNNLAILYHRAGQREEQERLLAESTALRERLVALTPKDDARRDVYQSNLASCYQNMGEFIVETGRTGAARELFRKALAIQQEQLKARPNLVEFLERVGVTYACLGKLEVRIGEFPSARAELEKAQEYLERLNRIRPGDANYRLPLIDVLGALSDTESESRSPLRALELARRAVSESEETLRVNPSFHPASDRLALNLRRGAKLLWELGDPQQATSELDRAEALLGGLVAKYAESTEYQQDLIELIRSRVRMDREVGRGQDAERRLRRATELTDKIASEDPGRVSGLALSGALHADLARTLVELGRASEAFALFQRAVDLLEQAHARAPDSFEPKHLLVEALASRAHSLCESGRAREAVADVDHALAMATGEDAVMVHLARATTLAHLSDTAAALAEARAAEREISSSSRLLLDAAALHSVLAQAASGGPVPSPIAATQRDAALEWIRRARAAPAFHDRRRLLHGLSAPAFDSLRKHPGFSLLLSDLAFPADPFAPARGHDER